ncbi:MAG: hypothetical protein AB1648_00805 [Pseudomonadota bacterium]
MKKTASLAFALFAALIGSDAFSAQETITKEIYATFDAEECLAGAWASTNTKTFARAYGFSSAKAMASALANAKNGVKFYFRGQAKFVVERDDVSSSVNGVGFWTELTQSQLVFASSETESTADGGVWSQFPSLSVPEELYQKLSGIGELPPLFLAKYFGGANSVSTADASAGVLTEENMAAQVTGQNITEFVGLVDFKASSFASVSADAISKAISDSSFQLLGINIGQSRAQALARATAQAMLSAVVEAKVKAHYRNNGDIGGVDTFDLEVGSKATLRCGQSTVESGITGNP